MKSWDGVTVMVFGISGVGKTWLIQKTRERLAPVLTWRASEMIGAARKIADSDELRRLPANELQASQELLVRGFTIRRRERPHDLVILDAHSVIDADSGLFDIPVNVVARLYPAGIIHVRDAAQRIWNRRDTDPARLRPLRTVAELDRYQERSVETCRLYRDALQVPLLEVTSGDEEAFIGAIRRIVA
jgi:adenylate kinase